MSLLKKVTIGGSITAVAGGTGGYLIWDSQNKKWIEATEAEMIQKLEEERKREQKWHEDFEKIHPNFRILPSLNDLENIKNFVISGANSTDKTYNVFRDIKDPTSDNKNSIKVHNEISVSDYENFQEEEEFKHMWYSLNKNPNLKMETKNFGEKVEGCENIEKIETESFKLQQGCWGRIKVDRANKTFDYLTKKTI
ncbi:hypothetical protein MHSWG343_10440 [Candidatus Mycoplasma haematohominis]|uniref:Uncharacterized protein n=1 Tax=Candidatus Mycoplasma haematohominis TaxID=1494318 RepID=A0A478FUM0_9MOLU|nr:hypothetical protein MHSWG343_10440 [Candidatus Mycoplasma haemohominis]